MYTFFSANLILLFQVTIQGGKTISEIRIEAQVRLKYLKRNEKHSEILNYCYAKTPQFYEITSPQH